jgi:hypothetical protein
MVALTNVTVAPTSSFQPISTSPPKGRPDFDMFRSRWLGLKTFEKGFEQIAAV